MKQYHTHFYSLPSNEENLKKKLRPLDKVFIL